MSASVAQRSASPPMERADLTLAIVGFVLVATAQASNVVVSRGLAGTVPPFSIAFFRWSIVACVLAPFALRESRQGRLQLNVDAPRILLAGFFGMFLCGGPVYLAGHSTTAINMALIMALSPITVLLLSRILGLESIGALQVAGTCLALAGALVIISGGKPGSLLLLGAGHGDLLMLAAMLGWSGYTLLQTRIARQASVLARVSMFAASGALISFPIAIWEWSLMPEQVFSQRAAAVYLFTGLVPGVFAYAAFAYLSGRFGSVRTSLLLYLAPVASGVLSFALLAEPPTMAHWVGGSLVFLGIWASLRKR